MKRFLEFVLCILHPIARVLIWINLATRTNLELIPKFTRRDCGGRALRVSRVCAHCQRLPVADGQAGLCVGRMRRAGFPSPGPISESQNHGARPQVLGKTIVPVRPNNLERRDPRHHAGAGESATDAALVAWRSRIPSVAGRGSSPGGRGRRALSMGNREVNSPKDVSLSPCAATVRDAG
jgi:hypothetical protein